MEEALPRLGLIDSLMVLAYLVMLWWIAFRGHKKATSDSEYLLAGRSLTLPAFVATLVTTWYGGILGVGEFSWLYGISTWLVFGLPYYLHAIIFAIFIAPRAREMNFTNLPDQLEKHYGRNAAIVGAAIIFITTVPAAYLLMLAILIQTLLPVSKFIALIIGALLSGAYLWRGGFRAVVQTDKLQFILMFSGFAVLLIFLLTNLPIAELPSRLPTTHLTWHGGNTLGFILLWYIVAAQTYIEPTFHQRCYAAKSPATARKGILLSVVAWLVFDLMTTMAGLYSRALVPELLQPIAAFPALASMVLPVGILGLFICGLFATVMSTVDSYGFLAALTLGRDFFGRIIKDGMKNQERWTRLSLIPVALIAIGLASWRGSVITLWKELGSIITPALLIPLLTSFFPRARMRPEWGLPTILAGALTALLWMSGKYLTVNGNYPFGWEPLYPALILTLILYIVERLVTINGAH